LALTNNRSIREALQHTGTFLSAVRSAPDG